MQFKIEVIEEHEDGSATCNVDMDLEAMQALIERGVIAILTEYVNQRKEKYEQP